MNITDLQKALDKFPNDLKSRWLDSLETGQIRSWLEDYKAKVSAFQRNLKERVLEIDNPSNDYGEVCKQNRQYRTLLKELLSTSAGEKPHYFTVSEAREKLKEGTKC